MRPINLLPAGIAEERVRRRRVFLIIAVIAAYVFLLVVGVFYWNTKVANKAAEVEKQEQVNGSINADIAALGQARDLQADLATHQGLVTAALAGEVDWGRFVADLGRETPGTVWLINMNGSATESQVGGLVAQISVSGKGLTGYGDVSAWIRNLDDLEGASVTGIWVPTAQRQLDPLEVNFTSTAVLTSFAGTNRINSLIPQVEVE